MGEIKFLIAIMAANGIILAACDTNTDITTTSTPQGGAQVSGSICEATKILVTIIPIQTTPATTAPAANAPEAIIVGISFYVLVDDSEFPDPLLSSRPTKD